MPGDYDWKLADANPAGGYRPRFERGHIPPGDTVPAFSGDIKKPLLFRGAAFRLGPGVLYF
jgi:hypothetical protein